MEKHLIDRRIRQMEAEGVAFRTGVEVGKGVSVSQLMSDYDAVVLSGGAEAPRDLPVDGRNLDGIHFAMDSSPSRTSAWRATAKPRPRRTAPSAPRASMWW